ncbi:SHOCT domain-containing protein [Sesbania bispinosa]|nr:SHOCT domain-containing protein [Sesbania bispinosa]
MEGAAAATEGKQRVRPRDGAPWWFCAAVLGGGGDGEPISQRWAARLCCGRAPRPEGKRKLTAAHTVTATERGLGGVSRWLGDEAMVRDRRRRVQQGRRAAAAVEELDKAVVGEERLQPRGGHGSSCRDDGGQEQPLNGGGTAAEGQPSLSLALFFFLSLLLLVGSLFFFLGANLMVRVAKGRGV